MDVSRDVWEDFKPLIKQLYEVDGKTAKEVKDILERQYGFPKTPLSTYQTKLKDKLGFRKRLHASDWPRIYHYARANGFDKFDVYLNGAMIPPKKAWKEFRRYGVRRSTVPPEPLATLPEGIEIRMRSGSIPRQLSAPVTPPRSTTELPSTGSSLVPRHATPSQNAIEQLDVDMIGDLTSVVTATAARLSPTIQPVHTERDLDILASWTPDFAFWNSTSPRWTSTLTDVDMLDVTSGSTTLVPVSQNFRNMASAQGCRGTMSGSADSTCAMESQSVWLWHTDGEPASLARSRYLFARFHLDNLPWNQYRLSLQAMRNGQSRAPIGYRDIGGQSFALMSADGFFGDVPSGLPVPISDSSYPTAGDLYNFAPHSGAVSTHFDPYHFLAEVVYIFSNNLHRKQYGADDAVHLLDILAHRVRQSVVLSIFKSSSRSIRALWEALLHIARIRRVKSGLHLLINIALQSHPEWLETDKPRSLRNALRTGDVSLVQKLLDSNFYLQVEEEFRSTTIFGVAAASGAVDCAKLLIKHWNPNSYCLAHPRRPPVPTFSVFVRELVAALPMSCDPEPINSIAAYLDILGLLLEAGVNVDAAYPGGQYGTRLKTTCLDMAFYSHRSIFDLMLPHSRKFRTQLTRAGLCVAISQGKDALTGYLNSIDPAPITAQKCLESILDDQFKVSYDKLGALHRARVIAEYAISVMAWKNPFSTKAESRQRALERTVSAAVSRGLSTDLTFLLACFARSDTGTGLPRHCISETGTEVLEALIQHGFEIGESSETLLLESAEKNNYDAISLLLKLGVDINGEVEVDKDEDKDEGNRMTVLSHLMRNGFKHTDDFQAKKKMWTFFIEQGATLRHRRRDATCYQLLAEIIEHQKRDESESCAWETFRFVLHYDDNLSQSQWLDLLHLSLKMRCEDESDWRITETIFRRCGPIVQPILAEFVRANCTIQFVEDLLRIGQGLNDYSSNDLTPVQAAASKLRFDLVSYLHRVGADLNSPAKGEHGGTALQLACGTMPHSSEEMDRQRRLIKMMVMKGAHVNAPAVGRFGATALQLLCSHNHSTPEQANHLRQLVNFLIESGANVNSAPGLRSLTALQHCAKNGDLAKVVILVQHGVDPNGYPAIDSSTGFWMVSALDIAVRNGRLDVTQYLLNIGALSATPGSTGYHGAISVGRDAWNHAVVRIISKHVDKVAERHRESPGMLAAYQRLVQQHTEALERKKRENMQFEWGIL